MRKFILLFFISLIPTSSRTQVSTNYTIVLEVNNGTIFVGIKSPYIASLSSNGEQYIFFKDSTGNPHIFELCELEPDCVDVNGLRLVNIEQGE